MAPRVAFVAALALFLHGVCAGPGRAQRAERGSGAVSPEPGDVLPDGGEGEDCTLGMGAVETLPAPTAPVPAPVPTSAPDTACVTALTGRGVTVRPLDAVAGVQTPLELGAALGGVTIRSHGRGAAASLSIADCRLLSALLTWMPELTRIGVVGIEHMSIYRSGARVSGSGRPSGHSHALAIDLSHLIFADGTTFEVETDWETRDRGADVCAERPTESARMRSVRAAVCAASRSGLFQVVLTPHADAAHGNHVHLEVRPDVSWTILR